MTATRSALLAAAFASTLFEGDARAQSDDLCLGPYERGQELRHDGHLRAARDELRACARQTCPRPVQVDCTKWLDELAAAIPTVVVQARDARGADVTGVRVAVDGTAAPDYADGRPLELDPGVHVLRLEHAGEVVDQQIVVREAERDRAVAVVFPGQPAVPPPATSHAPTQTQTQTQTAPPPAHRESAPPSRPIPASAWVLGTVGLAGVASFATFGLLGFTKHAQLRGSCAPTCSDALKSPIVTDYAIGDVSLAVAVVTLGIATWVVLTRPTVTVGLGGAGLQGEF